MGIINSNKTIGNITNINCQGELNVTLGIIASPDIQSNPVDIVLILDRSTSMQGQPLADLKIAVDAFIDIIESATGGIPGEIGSGSRIGIVSFADTAVQDTALITSVTDLKTAANALAAGGFTNHGDAFTQAADLLSASVNNKVMVMFTDGETTTGPNPSPIAAAARGLGITIYCIGLAGSGGINVNALNDWATDPDITHVAVAPDSSQLAQLFADLAANIAVPGATNIVINETINPDFTIVGTPVATIGTISALTDTSFQWDITQLGVAETESASVTFKIEHTADTSGHKHVNQSLVYTDTEGNAVTFADPMVFVSCGPGYVADPCGEPVDVNITGCDEYVIYDAGDLMLEDNGRILELDVNLLNVCPGKSIALAAVLTEEDQYGTEKSRGTKIYTIPPHNLTQCSDVLVTCIRFILPDNMSDPCADRYLKARFFAHYIDSGFVCCNEIMP